MSKVAGKWIEDAAITTSKLDSSSSFTVAGLTVNGDSSATGDMYVGGQVGIGATNPGGAVEIYDTTNALLLFNIQDSTVGSRVGEISMNGLDQSSNATEFSEITTVIVDNTEGSEDGRIDFNVMSAGSMTNKMTVAPTSVGIGTTNPQSKLSLKQASNTATEGIRIQNSTTDYFDQWLDANGALFVTRNGVDRVVIDSAGDVGIGTTDPQSKLSVYQSSNMATQGIRIQNSSTDYFDQWLNANGALLFTRNGTDRVIINESGQVGIGTTTVNDSCNLDIAGSGNRRLGIRNNTLTTTGEIGTIRFYNAHPTNYRAAIIAQQLGSNDSELQFYTMDSGTASQNVTFFSGGQVGIGTGTALATLGLFSSGGPEIIINREISANVGNTLGSVNFGARHSGGSYATGARIIATASSSWTSSDREAYLSFYTSDGTTNTEHMRITSAGGIHFYNLAGDTGSSDVRWNSSTKELFYDTSARKYKENIRENPDTSFLQEIKVVVYDRKVGSRKDEIGIIADALEKIAPTYCNYNSEGEIESYNKSDLVPVLINELQKQQKIINSLMGRIEALEAK